MNDWYRNVSLPKFHRALWVVGTSVAGKSTFARAVATVNGIQVLECGQWIRAMHHPDCGPPELTATTLSILGKDARYFSCLIGRELGKHDRVVVTGSRNPIDFVDNFDVRRDGVVLLGTRTFQPQTDFERAGVDAIEAYIKFLLACQLLVPERVVVAEPER